MPEQIGHAKDVVTRGGRAEKRDGHDHSRMSASGRAIPARGATFMGDVDPSAAKPTGRLAVNG
jgi:hypothetical protein